MYFPSKLKFRSNHTKTYSQHGKKVASPDWPTKAHENNADWLKNAPQLLNLYTDAGNFFLNDFQGRIRVILCKHKSYNVYDN